MKVVAVSEDLCSARIETLRGWADIGVNERVELGLVHQVAALDGAWEACLAACEFRDVEGNPGPELQATIDQFRTNESWVRGIATALAEAPAVDGIAHLGSGEVAAALDGDSRGPDTGFVAYDNQEIVGLPVTSGLVNDPVNAANGNFVHADRDILTPGFGAVLDVLRTYNSLNGGRLGVFGAGWTSLLDASLDLTSASAGTVRLSFTDGSVIPFERDTSRDGWTRNRRRGLTLEETPTGWLVTRELAGGESRRFRFDSNGRLTGGDEGVATYTIEWGDRETWADERITVREERSGRWVRYELDHRRLVAAVATSDGRQCRYRYDEASRCVGVERSVGNLSYEHDESGFVTRSVDADGVAAFTNSYDDVGRVIAQVAPHGRRTTFDYLDNGGTRVTDDADGPSNLLFHDRNGNLLALYGSDGAAMRAAYDDRGRLARHIDRAGATTVYAYDELDRITRRTDPDGLAEHRDYDEQGRVVRQIDRSGAAFSFSYDGANPNPTLVEGPEGVRIGTTYDDRWLPVTIVDSDGVTTQFEWDTDGQLVACVNGAGERTTLTYDPTGPLTSVTEPDGVTAVFSLDASGRVETSTDAAGSMQIFTTSAAGRMLSMTTSGPGSWSATYGPHGDVVSFTDAAGATIGYDYDEMGRITALTAPDGAVTTQVWNGVGLLVESVDPSGHRTKQRHDKAGRPIEVNLPDGRTYSRTVDVLGRTVDLTEPDGAVHHRTYHPNGQVASATDAAGRTHRYEVDRLGRIVAEVAPDGGRRSFTYSPASRLTSETTAEGRTYSYTYDAAGRPASVTDADGVITELGAADRDSIGPRAAGADSPHTTPRFGLDGRSLLTEATSPDGTVTSFEHDRRGRFARSVTGHQQTSVLYDRSGAVASTVDQTGAATRFQTGPGGLLDAVFHDGSGRVGEAPAALGLSIGRDAAGRVCQIADLHGTPLATFGYDRSGALLEASTPSTDRPGTSLLLERDGHGAVIGVTDSTSGSSHVERDADGVVVATIDTMGRRTTHERTTAGHVVAFVDDDAGSVAPPLAADPSERHDRTGRLVVDRHGRRYTYDFAGRLEASTSPTGSVWRFTFNDLGLLATDARSSADGTKQRRLFTYDLGGQLTELVTPAGTTRFTYDTAGRRTSRIEPDGSTTTYAWDSLDRLAAITHTSPGGDRHTRRLSHNAIGQLTSVDDITIGWDHVISGKPIRIGHHRYLRAGTNVRPALPDATWFDGTFDDPYGTGAGGGIRLGYRGELTIDGLVVMGARIYDPDTRTFLTKDPNPPVPGANGSFASPYEYGWADPVNHVDPTGREPVTIEEFEAWRTRQESNRFERAGQAILDDPWGSLAMGAMVIGGTVLLATPFAPIGAGILIGAASTAAFGLATDNFNPRSVAIGAAFGAVPGGHTVRGAFVAGFGESVTSQVVIDGRGFGDISIGEALVGGTFGAVIPAGLATRNHFRPTGPIADVIPPGVTGGSGGAPPPGQLLYRADGRLPSTIEPGGFSARNPLMSQYDHLSGGNGLVSTSMSPTAADNFGIRPPRTVYVIEDPGTGYTVDYGGANRSHRHLRHEAEVNFDRIEAESIIGSFSERSGPTGGRVWQPNPGYVPISSDLSELARGTRFRGIDPAQSYGPAEELIE